MTDYFSAPLRTFLQNRSHAHAFCAFAVGTRHDLTLRPRQADSPELALHAGFVPTPREQAVPPRSVTQRPLQLGSFA